MLWHLAHINTITQLQVATGTFGNKWPNGVVPYSTDGFSTRELGNIREAMDMYMNGTCVSFRQRQPYDRAYVQITKGSGGECSSNVGMVTARGTVGVSRTVLSDNCSNVGSILHELGHILGRYHEHSRLDRDIYVEILYHNIYAYAISNFFIYFDTYTLVAYDYNSIMHYDSRAYSMNGLDTIRALHNISTALGQRLYLTELDYANINFMYNCSTLPLVSTLISPTTYGTSVLLLESTGTPMTFTSSPKAPLVSGLVLTSSPLAPVYTTTPKMTLPQAPLVANRTLPPPVVYPLNSQCICHRNICCIYKVLLYFILVFLY